MFNRNRKAVVSSLNPSDLDTPSPDDPDFRFKEGRRQAAMETYAQLAKGWETDRMQAARRSARLAWIVAGFACVLSCVLGLAIFGMTPLHRIEPFVIVQEKATGHITTLAKLSETSKTQSEAVNKSFVSNYVRAREGYSRELAEVNYQTVALMSSPKEGQIYQDWFKPDAPTSPLKIYGMNGTVVVRILNVSFVAPQVASVRYEKTVRENNRVTRQIWTATVAFRYSNAPMSEEDRLINPIGFEVTDYRNDPEVGGSQ